MPTSLVSYQSSPEEYINQHDKQEQTAAQILHQLAGYACCHSSREAQRLNQLAGYACCHGSNDVSSEKINNLAKQPMAVCIIHRLT
jgi:hypothetical protein